MKRLVSFKSAVIAIVIVLSSSLSAFSAPSLQNGDFSAGLTGWNVEYGTVTDGGGHALFQEDPLSLSSTMSQYFTIPNSAQYLSFDVLMSSLVGGDYDPYSWPDAFTASLLDAATLDPLIFNPGLTEFYCFDNHGNRLTIATTAGNNVMLDVSGLAGQNVLLSFDLWSGMDGLQATVQLDNVNVSVIPAPGALLLTSFGVGLIAKYRRNRNI